jgi:serine/threonine protein phosphatase PrpC
VGSFRDDDYSYNYFEKTDWSVVAVADGAGSASFSRKGSLLACEEVIRYFTEIMPLRDFISFETKINAYAASNDPAMLEAATIEAKKGLYKATLHVHKKIHEVAEATAITHPELFTNSKAKNNGEYFHSTLIFTAFKKFDIGCVILTFGVGDCPIGIVNANRTEAKLLNWLDVGEFGGGTRFITQADIFHSNERPMASRFNLHIHPDFSYLFLMTDGIYDPKFEVEANLEKNEKWLDFIADITGVNDDNLGVDFKSADTEIQAQLDTWMDFWSKGNHDDRTLAIIY